RNISGSDAACDGGGKLGCRKVTNNPHGCVCPKKCVECDEHARVEIDGHWSSSSRRLVKSSPASSNGTASRIRYSVSQSKSAAVTAERALRQAEHRDRMAVPGDHDLPALKSTVD